MLFWSHRKYSNLNIPEPKFDQDNKKDFFLDQQLPELVLHNFAESMQFQELVKKLELRSTHTSRIRTYLI
jgi:predicted DNA binding CopG/RHH family protein